MIASYAGCFLVFFKPVGRNVVQAHGAFEMSASPHGIAGVKREHSDGAVTEHQRKPIAACFRHAQKFMGDLASRLISGAICDRIGGLRTLLLGTALQAVALLLFLPFDGLTSLYVIAALFGLFQGGIIPAYAIIVREHFSSAETGIRVGVVLMATLIGMALGGWMSGAVFDLTGSYRAAFLNGIAWNQLNVAIVLWLMLRPTRRLAHA